MSREGWQDGIDRKPNVDELLEPDRFKKVKILVEIVNIQPYISSYYEAKNPVEGQTFDLKQIPLKPPKGINNVLMDKDGELYWTKPEVDWWT
jgi:hypothetical protein